MNDHQRVVLKYQMVQLVPFFGSLLVLGVLALTSLLRWWLFVGFAAAGIGAYLALTAMAALAVGPFAKAPLMVRVQAKVWLLSLGFLSVSLWFFNAVQSWLPAPVKAASAYLSPLIFVVVYLHPLFGYGPLGREMNAAVKENERASELAELTICEDRRAAA